MAATLNTIVLGCFCLLVIGSLLATTSAQTTPLEDDSKAVELQTLLEADKSNGAIAAHENQSPREARQFFGPFPFGYGGGGFYRPGFYGGGGFYGGRRIYRRRFYGGGFGRGGFYGRRRFYG